MEILKEKKQEEKIATVRGLDLPVSRKQCVAICNFIRDKNPDEAIVLLNNVIKKKVAVPMKGEIPHRKGMASGRYPVKAASYFIKMIKNVVANASVKGMNTGNLVLNGISNKGATFHHSGRRRGQFKRTNVTIIAKERHHKEKKQEMKKVANVNSIIEEKSI